MKFHAPQLSLVPNAAPYLAQANFSGGATVVINPSNPALETEDGKIIEVEDSRDLAVDN